jgi:hypothetical protein
MDDGMIWKRDDGIVWNMDDGMVWYKGIIDGMVWCGDDGSWVLLPSYFPSNEHVMYASNCT